MLNLIRFCFVCNSLVLKREQCFQTCQKHNLYMTYVAHTSRERNGSTFTFVAGHEIYQIYFARKQNLEVNTESALRKVPKTENEAHETFENNLK